MPEEQHKPKSVWWMAGLSIAGVVLLLLGAGWIWLPDIAAFGLRFDATRQVSRNTLKWLGPRAIRCIFEQEHLFRGEEWVEIVEPILLEADSSEYSLQLMLKSLGDLNRRGERKATLLHWAAWRGCQEVARGLVKRGADIEARDVEGMRPLHCAMQHPRMAELLLDSGAMVDARDGRGMTPLYWAAMEGCYDTAEVLISHGADVNSEDTHGFSPLARALGFGHHQVADLLRKHGAEASGL